MTLMTVACQENNDILAFNLQCYYDVSEMHFKHSTITSLILIAVTVNLVTCCASVIPDTSVQRRRGIHLQRMLEETIFSHNSYGNIVDASTFGFDKTDSTAIIQRALDSGARYVRIPNMNKPWITDRLHVRSNTTLILSEGTEIAAKKGAFIGKGDSLLNLTEVENVTIFGYGATLRMNKSDYRKPPYENAQWRCTIVIRGCRNIYLYGITAESSGGDGIYIGRGNRTYNENIIIQDITLRDHHRQGISVISAQHLLIKNVELSFTEGNAPSAGIDFEPNKPDERLVDCIVTNCIIRNNRGPGVLMYLANQNGDSMPFSISISSCIVQNNLWPVMISAIKDDAAGEIRLENNTLSGFSWIPGSTERVKIVVE
jgi:polygalacturonase